jgi:flagellar basal-body rod protein FlgF
VSSEGAVVGQLKVVEFADPRTLMREGPYLVGAANQTPTPSAGSEVRSKALERSNVSVVDRIAELATVTRNFETMQRALSTLSNDVDLRAITELGRRA